MTNTTISGFGHAAQQAAIVGVFRLLDKHIALGEIVQVRISMKKVLRLLWPAD